MSEEKKLIKDKECIHCEKMFDCEGKERGKLCIQMKERRTDGLYQIKQEDA